MDNFADMSNLKLEFSINDELGFVVEIKRAQEDDESAEDSKKANETIFMYIGRDEVLQTKLNDPTSNFMRILKGESCK